MHIENRKEVLESKYDDVGKNLQLVFMGIKNQLRRR